MVDPWSTELLSCQTVVLYCKIAALLDVFCIFIPKNTVCVTTTCIRHTYFYMHLSKLDYQWCASVIKTIDGITQKCPSNTISISRVDLRLTQ